MFKLASLRNSDEYNYKPFDDSNAFHIPNQIL